jgi:hypothetical protein
MGILDRLPQTRLDVNKTFDSQRQDVNKIIPVIQKGIKNKFLVTNGVIRHIIHERHRHQRESFLNTKRSANWNDSKKRRKHANSRRSEVSKKSGWLFFFFVFFLIILSFRNENGERKRSKNYF